MQRIDNNGSVLKLSLLALAIVAVVGCSSNDSSSQPLNPGDGSGSGGGEGGNDGGGDPGPDGGDQDFTYRTVNPANAIPSGESFSLDTTTIKPTVPNEGSGEGIIINAGPTVSVSAKALITVLDDTADGNARLRLQDPDNGLDLQLLEDSSDPGLYTNSDGAERELFSQDSSIFPSGGLSYAAYGFWSVPVASGSSDLDVGFFAGGYATQNGDMPTTGTASFAGAANGFSIASDGSSVDVIGNASMSVDFAAATLTGAMTNMTSGADIDGALNSTTPWNDVRFSGTLTDNAFTAGAEVTSSPNNAATLGADASGSLNGRFYGPQAAEAAGTWGLRDSGGGIAFGGFGVKKD